MVTKQELLGTIKVPTELPLQAFVAASSRGLGAMFCLHCGSVKLYPPESMGAFIAIIQCQREEDGKEWPVSPVEYDRLYLTRPECGKCGEEELDVKTLDFAYISFPEETPSQDSESPEDPPDGDVD